MGLFDVVTRESGRRRGFARTIVAALLRWGWERGARRSYLQVEEGNAPAVALYDAFGFSMAYRYWYRARPGETA
ncbi:MAG: GNAT family N-acetyltransferase [Betaproteobacteria bacterium]|nr:GNAT family N-acetyltransferase [Betaproteobacteria bacterium]